MSGQERPRHSRAEIRAFADELDQGGWIYEGQDASGHTIWSHPRATGQFKLPETPRHFGVQRARRDVARLLGQRVPGKRNGKPKTSKPERRDFVLESASRQARQRVVSTAPPTRTARRRLPWEGADQPDHYDHGLDQMMREVPGSR